MSLLKTLTPVMIVLAIGCKSQSEKILDKFKEINENLERTNKTVDSILLGSDSRTDSTALDLKSVGFDPSVADSLGNLFIQTRAYLIRLKEELKKADSKGENLDASQNLLIKTPKGDSLYNYMLQVYNTGTKYGDSASRILLTDLKKYGKDKWLARYFNMLPTVAAITILSKFQNDLGNTKVAIMSAYKKT